MDGITYLANTPITHSEYVSGFSTHTCILILIGLVIGLLPIFIIALYNGISFKKIISKYFYRSFCWIAISIIFFSAIGIAHSKKQDIVDYYTWDVIVSDDVKFNEFNDAYEILNVHGEIYTIKEKTIGSIQRYLKSIENSTPVG